VNYYFNSNFKVVFLFFSIYLFALSQCFVASKNYFKDKCNRNVCHFDLKTIFSVFLISLLRFLLNKYIRAHSADVQHFVYFYFLV